jgi:TIR domain
MERTQDLFISHAGKDKEQYIVPLAQALTTHGISFWLDNIEVAWGDSITMKINKGLRTSRYVLLCLSKNFLGRNWPESEMGAVLAIQNNTGRKRALPLILNDKEEILEAYPILSALAYREFGVGPDKIATELAGLMNDQKKPEGLLQVIIESVHTGQLCNLMVSPRVSIKWLTNKARAGLNLREEVETGGFIPFRIRWVLVDASAEKEWGHLPRYAMQQIQAIVNSKEGVKFSYDETDRLEDLGIYDGIVFHLYAIEDVQHGPPLAAEG